MTQGSPLMRLERWPVQTAGRLENESMAFRESGRAAFALRNQFSKQ
jgi:hypothetical protein